MAQIVPSSSVSNYLAHLEVPLSKEKDAEKVEIPVCVLHLPPKRGEVFGKTAITDYVTALTTTQKIVQKIFEVLHFLFSAIDLRWVETTVGENKIFLHTATGVEIEPRARGIYHTNAVFRQTFKFQGMKGPQFFKVSLQGQKEETDPEKIAPEEPSYPLFRDGRPKN